MSGQNHRRVVSFCKPSLDRNECNGSVELQVHDKNNTLGREEVEVDGDYVVVTLPIPDLALPHIPFNLAPCCSMIQFIEPTQFVHDFIIFHALLPNASQLEYF